MEKPSSQPKERKLSRFERVKTAATLAAAIGIPIGVYAIEIADTIIEHCKISHTNNREIEEALKALMDQNEEEVVVSPEEICAELSKNKNQEYRIVRLQSNTVVFVYRCDRITFRVKQYALDPQQMVGYMDIEHPDGTWSEGSIRAGRDFSSVFREAMQYMYQKGE